jgi:hypothetical protein
VANKKKKPVSGWLSRILDGYNVKGTAVYISEASCSDEIRSSLYGENGTIHSARKDKRQGSPDKLHGLVHELLSYERILQAAIYSLLFCERLRLPLVRCEIQSNIRV